MIMKDRDVSNTARAVRKLCCLKKLGRQKKGNFKTMYVSYTKKKKSHFIETYTKYFCDTLDKNNRL